MGLPTAKSLSCQCTHVKGHGGLKATINDVQRHLPHFQFVMRTDVKGYYRAIDHWILLQQLSRDINDRFLFRLLYLYLKRVVERGGVYTNIEQGIARGCSLSPLIGAYYLKVLDEKLSEIGVYYVRYMDDILIMATTRWRFKRAISLLNQTLNQYRLHKHPGKTQIGRISRGFDFLGYHFSRRSLTLAMVTISHFRANIHRLYEQKKTAPSKKSPQAARLDDYMTRWFRWAQAGLEVKLAFNVFAAGYPEACEGENH